MKLLYLFFPFLLCSGSITHSMNTPVSNIIASSGTDELFDESHLHQIPSKLDLMPQAGKDLITRLKDPDKYPQPSFVFFCGPQGCGKSTLIDQLTASIGADRVHIQYNGLMNHFDQIMRCKNQSGISQDDINNAVQDLITFAYQKAQAKNCPYAVIAFEDFDTLYDDTSDLGKALHRRLFESISDCKDRKLLILAESTGKLEVHRPDIIASIDVEYPSFPQYMKLAAYFLKQFKLNADETAITLLAVKGYSKSIKNLREAARDLAYLNAKVPANPNPISLYELSSKRKSTTPTDNGIIMEHLPVENSEQSGLITPCNIEHQNASHLMKVKKSRIARLKEYYCTIV